MTTCFVCGVEDEANGSRVVTGFIGSRIKGVAAPGMQRLIHVPDVQTHRSIVDAHPSWLLIRLTIHLQVQHCSQYC